MLLILKRTVQIYDEWVTDPAKQELFAVDMLNLSKTGNFVLFHDFNSKVFLVSTESGKQDTSESASPQSTVEFKIRKTE